MNKYFKYCLALALNIIPFFLSCFLYEGGITVSLMLPIIQVLINLLNYKWTEKILSFVFLNFAMLVSSVASVKISTWIYYNNISSDTETLAVGQFEVWFCIIFIVIMTLISIICRHTMKEHRKA